MDDIRKIVDSYRDDIIQQTVELIKCESVEAEAKPGMPFGEGINHALTYTLDLAESLGFTTCNDDGYAGHADLGDSDDMVGVLVHVDVVPEGSGWEFPAFGGVIQEGRIYGRGSTDMKGPAIASIYAMKALKELGAPLKKKIRLIVGTHEESTSGWVDLKHYFSNFPKPDIGFSPDADFPVIYGEKGLLNYSFHYTLEADSAPVQFTALRGGNAPNMVPDLCEAELTVQDGYGEELERHVAKYQKETGYPVSMERVDSARVIIRGEGVSVHASIPETGKNAISFVFDYLSQCPGLNVSAAELARHYCDKIGFEVNGESVGCALEDDISGKLTFNVGVAAGDHENVKLTVNLRYPIKSEGGAVIESIKKAFAGTGIEFRLIDDSPPLFVPKEDELVQKLMRAYRTETGDTASPPITVGGGTYARALPKGVAFGAKFPGKEYMAHQKNEYIEIEELMCAARIYALALYELACC